MRTLARLVPALLAILAIAGAVVIGTQVPPSQPTVRAAPAQTARVWQACPALTGEGVESVIAGAASGPGLVQAGLADAGAAIEVPGVAEISSPAEPLRLGGPRDLAFGGATGALAARGGDRGLGATPCLPAGGLAWFPGVRSGADARSELVLVNLDEADAEVNVTVLGEGGRLAAPGARAIAVVANTQRLVPLEPMVTSETPVALRVETTSGRVAAFVRQRLYSGTDALGGDWVAPAAEPATVQVVTVVPAGPGVRELVVANPGDRNALVGVEVLGPTGVFAPVGAEQLDVPPESTRTASLALGLQEQAAVVRLTSDRPVTAAVESRSGEDAKELDWALAPASGLLGAGVATALPVTEDAEATLSLANPGAAEAVVTVRLSGPLGESLHSQDVPLAPGASAQVVLPRARTPRLEVTSTAPEVRAGVLLAQKRSSVAGIAVLPLADHRAESPSIAAVPDPHVGQ